MIRRRATTELREGVRQSTDAHIKQLEASEPIEGSPGLAERKGETHRFRGRSKAWRTWAKARVSDDTTQNAYGEEGRRWWLW